MIIFINGPFGIGKTTAAKLVAEQMDHALIFDPEIIGTLLQKVLGKLKPVGDFQEYRLWSSLTVQTASLLRTILRRPLIIPMTITDKDRWLTISKGLLRADPNMISVVLTSSEQELRKRILSRPDSEGSHEWCLAHIRAGMTLMQDTLFGEQIDTEGKTSAQVANAILDAINMRSESSHRPVASD